MPNLIPFIDTSEYYHSDIRRYYEFEEIEINLPAFKLFHFEGLEKEREMHLYLLTNSKEENLAILRLVAVDLHGITYYQICKSYSIVIQKGYGETLYSLCFNIHNGSFISDYINTLPGSYNLWKKILRKNPNAIRYDTKNNRKFPIDLEDEFLIWGVPNSFLEIILQTQWEAVIFENEYEDLDYGESEESYESTFVDYLSENDKMERTLLSDFIVEALKKKKKIKDRSDIVILI
ncbi:MAG: hypothetical protein ABI549_05535 [Flavobacterium sp.]|uniref:hypothetical protein n=1 Tax=Flavobacterium sp. TaxID=239 RepID=UPI003266B86E